MRGVLPCLSLSKEAVAPDARFSIARLRPRRSVPVAAVGSFRSLGGLAMGLAITFSPDLHAGVDVWTSTGPRAGWEFAVADPIRTSRMFIGSFADKALYVSQNGGRRFTRALVLPSISIAQYPYTVQVRPSSIAADPIDPDRIWLGTTSGAVLQSANGGGDWATVHPGGAFTLPWSRLIVAPWGTGDVYGVGSGFPDAYASMFVRKRATDPDFVPGPPAFDVVARAGHPGELLLVGPGGAARSTDAGVTWTPAGGLPAMAPGCCSALIVASPSDDARLYVVVRVAATPSDEGQIYRSDDGGATWVAVARLPAFPGIGRLLPDPHVRDRVHVLLDPNNAASTLLRSDDGGQTFRDVAVPGGAGPSFSVDGASGDVCVTNAIGLLCASSAGGPWRAIDTDLPGTSTDELRIARGQPGYVAALPGRSKAFGGGPWQSMQGGSYGFQGVGITSAGDDGRFLGVSGSQLVDSLDGGLSWQALRDLPPLEFDFNCSGLAVAPTDANRLIRFGDYFILSFLITTGCLGVSQDGGATFSDLSATPFNQGGRGAGRVVFDPQDANRVWLLGEPRNVGGGFYRSTDGGLTWSLVGSVRWWISIDPKDGRRMLVGPPVQYSENRGDTWTTVGDTLATVYGADVDWSAEPPQVFAATASGIWTAAWKSAAWQRVPGSADLDATDLKVAVPKDASQRSTVFAATTTGVWEFTRSSGLPFVPVFRFFNSQTGAHFYTASAAERDHVIATWPQFVYEGERFRVLASPAAGTVPVYRFYNTQTGVHFYTDDEAERDHVLATWPQFVYEGVAFDAFRPDPGTLQVHRFFNRSTGTHFYTTSADEAFTVVNNYPQFVDEGLRWAVYPVPPDPAAP